MQVSAVVTRTFLGALVALPVVAFAACSTAEARVGFDDVVEKDAAGASTDRATDSGNEGPSIAAGDAGNEPPVPPGTQIDLAAVAPCDAALDVEGDAEEFLKAIGLCKMAEEDSDEWGVIEARFVSSVGSDTPKAKDQQHGILPKFGDVLVPREGSSLGVLSTGWAREYDSGSSSSTRFRMGTSFGASGNDVPSDFDAETPRDLVNFRVKLRVPMNAKSFSFDFNFHSSEWPAFVSSGKNDKFIAFLTDSNNPDGANISFDSQNNPVSVNLTGELFDRCAPNANVGCAGTNETVSVCAGGTAELEGTGFGGTTEECDTVESGWGGATGWLTTTTPVVPGDVITIEFAVWDAGDSIYDSLILLDNFKWDADATTTGTTRPPS